MKKRKLRTACGDKSMMQKKNLIVKQEKKLLVISPIRKSLIIFKVVVSKEMQIILLPRWIPQTRMLQNI